jgi:hypothetical protein
VRIVAESKNIDCARASLAAAESGRRATEHLENSMVGLEVKICCRSWASKWVLGVAAEVWVCAGYLIMGIADLAEVRGEVFVVVPFLPNFSTAILPKQKHHHHSDATLHAQW